MTISNALALLTLNKNDVEIFTENVEVENLKVDELKNEIKKLKDEKELDKKGFEEKIKALVERKQ